MRLIDWQLAFEDYLRGSADGASAVLHDSLRGGPSLDVANGLAIYRNAYSARLREVLRADFPALRNWLGDDEFDALLDAYIQHYPSAHFSLRWLGTNVETFIRQHLVAAQSAPLAELARLEWAFTLAFDAADGDLLNLQRMAALSPEQWPLLRVALAPSVQWLSCHFNSLALWRAAKGELAFPASHRLEQPEVCLVWRRELLCHYRSLSAQEAWALAGMALENWTFAALCAQLADELAEGAPLQAVTWLKGWIEEGLLQLIDP